MRKRISKGFQRSLYVGMVSPVLSFKPRHLSGLVAERARANEPISRLQLLLDDLQSEL